MIITLDNLRAGIDWFRNRWGNDLLNGEYHDIYNALSGGITDQWWRTTVARLWAWKAIRSPIHPNTKAAIMAAGQQRLPEIAEYFSRFGTSTTFNQPSIADLAWEDAQEIFAVAYSIKPGSSVIPGSPVFASKFCHFVFPKVFTVMDDTATGIFEYEFYWRGMKDEWSRFPEKEEAIDILQRTVGELLHPCYPVETKIMELSRIGYWYPSKRITGPYSGYQADSCNFTR